MSELEQLRAELNEIGAFQNDVRDLVIKLTGAPSDAIDGKGSDAGWQEFTLAEISQGIAFVKDELERVKRQNAAMREAIEKERAFVARFLVPWRFHLSESWLDGFVEAGLVTFDEIGFVKAKAVPDDAGREYVSKESVRPIVAALKHNLNRWKQLAFVADNGAKDIESALAVARQLGLMEDTK